MVNRVTRACCLLLPLLGVTSTSGVRLAASAPPARTSPAETPGDWPRWRGARFDGTATTGTSALARPFTLRVRWKRALGAGYSGVVVADGHAVTMFSDGTRDFLTALSSRDGREQWRVPLAAAFPGRDGSAGGPVSTPALDEGVAFALGPRGDLIAVTLSTGKQVWRRNIVAEIGAAEPHWGFTTSPLVVGDLVIVLTGGEPGHAVTAFNKRTGATVWSAGTDVESYQSPMLAAIGPGNNEERLIVAGDQFLSALDPRDGREIWKYEHGGQGFYGKIINPVVVAPNALLLTSRADESVLLRGAAKPEPAWKTRELKLNYATPVVHGGLVFGYSGAFLTCVDAANGTLVWRSRPPGDGFPIVVDGHVVVLTKDGSISVAEASRAGFREKARLDVFSRLVWTPPSFAEGRIYARDSYSEIAAIDIVPVDRMTEATPPADARAGTAPASSFARWVADVERAPDAAARVAQFLASQPAFPIVEGDRYAHIVYSGPDADVVLRGDTLETGRDLPLRRVGTTDMYYASLEPGPDARLAYQFVRNLGEVIADPRNPLKAASLSYTGPVSLLFMPKADRSALSSTAPLSDGARGRVADLEYETGTVKAGHLTWGGKRKLHVYLPAGYDANPERRYPALYVMYGDEMLQDGHLDALLDREIGSTMGPVIAVFVQSTSGYEYARTFREAHRRMLAEELVPWIDARYRTVPDPAHRGLLGADEGAFGALDTGLRYPAIFGHVAAQSVFALSKGEDDLVAVIDKAPRTSQRFYVDWGRYDPHRRSDELDVPGVSRKLRDRLAARGFAVDGREWNDGSATVFWTTRVVPALRAMFPR